MIFPDTVSYNKTAVIIAGLLGEVIWQMAHVPFHSILFLYIQKGLFHIKFEGT